MKLARRVTIQADVDGVTVFPAESTLRSSLRISYNNGALTSTERNKSEDFLEGYGVIGLLRYPPNAYLIVITDRQRVASIRGHAVFLVTRVVLVPITNHAEARHVIVDAARNDERSAPSTRRPSADSVDTTSGQGKSNAQGVAASVAQDVIQRGGKYGRFAAGWFSSRGWTAEGRRSQGMSVSEAPEIAVVPSDNAPDLEQNDRRPPSLLSKLLRTTEAFFSTGGFYFSYDIDLTRRLCPKAQPAEPQFFWNSHLLQEFRGSYDELVLPIIQGFVGQRDFCTRKNCQSDQSVPLSLTLISRRSVKRAGLRYLRRGVDEEGCTANTVETEQIFSQHNWQPSNRTYSLVQLRGSIPLFFSQTPYSFKPVPVLQHSEAANEAAFRRHFDTAGAYYGNVHAVLLVDMSGGEKAIGEKYKAFCDRNALGFTWFDFHERCRGMKFDQIKNLVNDLNETQIDFGSTVALDEKVERSQNGVFRTSCMDCLDRTNVTQSAFAQRSLESQLEAEDLCWPEGSALGWFNSLWADNGDAISRQYSSTAALKGDYTRTGQRNYRGALNDFGLTISRYFNNVINDYFVQAGIDLLLGNVGVAEFEEYEQNMESRDPSVSISRARQNAIALAIDQVLAGAESLGSWIFMTPTQDTISGPLEEVVVLLTKTDIHCVRIDWADDALRSTEKVELNKIHGLSRGTYITSTLTPAQRDAANNVGLICRYRSSAVEKSGPSFGPFSKQRAETVKILALKAIAGSNLTQQHMLADFCASLTDALQDVNHDPPTMQEEDIISLQEAKDRTGLAKHWSHSLKRLVWG